MLATSDKQSDNLVSAWLQILPQLLTIMSLTLRYAVIANFKTVRNDYVSS